MSGMTVSEKYNCGHDCEWGSRCPGHGAQMQYSGTSEYYTLVFDGQKPIELTRAQMAVLLKMARQVDHERADAAAYVPEGWVLAPRIPTGAMLMAGGDVEEIHVEYGVDSYVENPEAIWAAQLAARPEAP